MQEISNLAEFVEAASSGKSCYTQIGIQDLIDNIETIFDLKQIKDSSAQNRSGLRGLCPLCNSWIDGETIGMILVIKQFGKEKPIMTQYGDLSHLLDGRCINSSCPSSKLLLIWKGDDAIRKRLTNHIQSLRTISEKNDAKIQVITKLEDEQVLSFSQDALFGFEMKCTNKHLMVGRKFPELVVWISVIPSISNAIKQTFPAGYKSFFNNLVWNSDYNEGNISIGHWISFEYNGNHVINLTLLSDKNCHGTDKEFVILPFEIMQETGSS